MSQCVSYIIKMKKSEYIDEKLVAKLVIGTLARSGWLRKKSNYVKQ